MEKNEFQRDQEIDPNALDVECMRQPELFFKWAEKAVEARGEVDKAKFRLEVMEAQCQMAVRMNPGEFKLEKVTEASIHATVKMMPVYQKALENHHAARLDAALLDKAVMAMEMKKRMLESLVTLHGQQYFAGPSTPRNLGEAYLLQQDAADEKAQERQTKRTRKPKIKLPKEV